jgi:hypothetical protein
VTSQFIAAAASVALLGAGFVGIDGTRSAEVLPAHQISFMSAQGASGGKCRVDVVRTGTAGVADITRSELTDGTCVCTVTTGQPSVNGSAESVVTSLLRDRSCDGAPAPGREVSQAASSGGGSGAVIPVLVTTVGAAGLAVAIGSDSNG